MKSMTTLLTLLFLCTLGAAQDVKKYENYSYKDWKFIFDENHQFNDRIEGIWKIKDTEMISNVQKFSKPKTKETIDKYLSIIFIDDRFYIFSIKDKVSIPEYEIKRVNCNQFSIKYYDFDPNDDFSETTLSFLESNFPYTMVNYTEVISTPVAKTIIKETLIKESNISINSIGKILISKSQGTGFLITNDGYLITNSHVINCVFRLPNNNSDCKIIIKTKFNDIISFFEAKIVEIDFENDLALLKINYSNPNLKFPFIDISEKQMGAKVFVLGFPMTDKMGESIKLTDGLISSNFGYNSSEKHYQISAPVNAGNSGGALYDESGKIVGVINAKLTNGENIGYCIKSKILKDFISKFIHIKNEIKLNNFISNLSIIENTVVIVNVFETICYSEK